MDLNVAALGNTNLHEQPVHQTCIPGRVFGDVGEPLAGLVEHVLKPDMPDYYTS